MMAIALQMDTLPEEKSRIEFGMMLCRISSARSFAKKTEFIVMGAASIFLKSTFDYLRKSSIALFG